MEDRTGYQEEESEESGGGGVQYQDNDFIRLEELVYAPLDALVKSNRKLRTEALETVRGLATPRQQGQEEILQLSNLKIAYDQVRSEEEDGCRVDQLQMQLPLLSLVPLGSLTIEQAEISFSAEVGVEDEKDGQYAVKARICSPEQRETDFLPKVNFQLKVGSLPAAEGILRLTDLLSANQVVQQTDTTPVNVKGRLGSEEQKNVWKQIDHLRARVKKLKALYQKIQNMLEEQEKLYQISKDGFAENAYDYDRDKYRMVLTNIINRIMKYQTQIMDLEVGYGLDQDYA